LKTCSYCGQEIPEDATTCPHCGTDLTAPQNQQGAPGPASTEPTGETPAAGWGWPGGPQGPEPPPPAGQQDDAPPPPSTDEAPPPPTDAAPTDDTVVLPASTPTAVGATDARVGEGALRFSHSGEVYILGYGAEFFGIWDRNHPGGPILQFPRSDQGWNEAWNRFSGMEKRFVEVPQTGTPPDVRTTSTSGFKTLRTLGGWLVVLLISSAALAVLTLALRGVEITRLQDFRTGLTSAAAVNDARNAANGVAVFGVFVILATAVVWLIWHHRAQANLRKLGVDGLRFTPAWVVWWWIIPFANFVMPPQATAETWRASEPATGAIEWKRKRLSPVFVVWWGAWLGRVPLASLASTASPKSGGTVEQLIRQGGYGIASDAATVVAAIAAIMIVRQITKWQHQKRDRMAAYGQAAAAAAP
jgi:uncharacterized protein DUF4328/zinc ribbon protein